MTPMRFAVAGVAAAALAGGGMAVVNAADTDANHGSLVSRAAHSCPHATVADRDIHGDCVSMVARLNHGHDETAPRPEPSEKAENANRDQHGDNVSTVAHSTPAPRGTEGPRDAHGDAVSTAARNNSGRNH